MSAAHTITNTGTANTITNTANTVTKTTWSWREADTANWQALLQQLLHLSSTSPALPALGLLPAPLQHCPPLGPTQTRYLLHATRYTLAMANPWHACSGSSPLLAHPLCGELF
eukprot:Tamp_09807.p3 GENE.Tamp_09807~~Tamp_09807.p3  ORF type:complete len:113 (-),score=6.69 Tamp_09807:493-831(-)